MNQRLVSNERNGHGTLASEVPDNLFARWRAGDTEAMNELLPLIYGELCYFGGLTIHDTALAPRITAATVKRDLTMARTWLRSELRSSPA